MSKNVKVRVITVAIPDDWTDEAHTAIIDALDELGCDYNVHKAPEGVTVFNPEWLQLSA